MVLIQHAKDPLRSSQRELRSQAPLNSTHSSISTSGKNEWTRSYRAEVRYWCNGCWYLVDIPSDRCNERNPWYSNTLHCRPYNYPTRDIRRCLGWENELKEIWHDEKRAFYLRSGIDGIHRSWSLDYRCRRNSRWYWCIFHWSICCYRCIHSYLDAKRISSMDVRMGKAFKRRDRLFTSTDDSSIWLNRLVASSTRALEKASLVNLRSIWIFGQNSRDNFQSC